MTAVLNWIKTNVFIVVFVGVMIAALVAFPLAASRMNAGIRADMKIRGERNGKLDALKKTPLDLGNATKEVLPNPRLLEQYRKIAHEKKADAEDVRKLCIRFNQKDRSVLELGLFPAPKQAEREVMPEQFHRKLVAAYAALLKEIGAGQPPSEDDLKADLVAFESGFRINDLRKGEAEALTPDESQRLMEELGRRRMSRYGDAAQKIRVYCTEFALDIPGWTSTGKPPMRDLFEWQWQYWINQDILEALSKANEGSPNVVQAPVKRVASIRLVDSAGTVVTPGKSGAGGTGGAGGAGGGGGGGMGFGMGGGGDGDAMPGKSRTLPRGTPSPGPSGDGEGDQGASSDSAASAGGVAVIDSTAEAPLDYAVSITGRKTNPIYDVRLVELRIVVRTESLPAVVDAIAARNFITILDLDLAPIDSFAAIRDGFFGEEPCSDVTLLLETVWLREWTTQWMPQDLLNVLGIKTQPKTVAAAPIER